MVSGTNMSKAVILPGRHRTGEYSVRRPLNWPYLLFSALLLMLGIAGLMRQMSLARLPADFPWSDVQWPVEVAGLQLADAENLRFLVEGFPAGETIRIPLPDGLRAIVTEAAPGWPLCLCELCGHQRRSH
jgi:hypothetical protein